MGSKLSFHGVHSVLSVAVSTTDRQVSRLVAFFHADERPIFSGFKSASVARSQVWLHGSTYRPVRRKLLDLRLWRHNNVNIRKQGPLHHKPQGTVVIGTFVHSLVQLHLVEQKKEKLYHSWPSVSFLKTLPTAVLNSLPLIPTRSDPSHKYLWLVCAFNMHFNATIWFTWTHSSSIAVVYSSR